VLHPAADGGVLERGEREGAVEAARVVAGGGAEGVLILLQGIDAYGETLRDEGAFEVDRSAKRVIIVASELDRVVALSDARTIEADVHDARGLAHAEEDGVGAAGIGDPVGVVGIEKDRSFEEVVRTAAGGEAAHAVVGVRIDNPIIEVARLVGGELSGVFNIDGVAEGILDRHGSNVLEKLRGHHLDLGGDVAKFRLETTAGEGVAHRIAAVLLGAHLERG
jgi:hypothetical protein